MRLIPGNGDILWPPNVPPSLTFVWQVLPAARFGRMAGRIGAAGGRASVKVSNDAWGTPRIHTCLLQETGCKTVNKWVSGKRGERARELEGPTLVP